MSNTDATGSPTRETARPRTTFAVEFVFEVENRTLAEELRDELPGPSASGVMAEGYRAYVDSAGLARPAVGASIRYADRGEAEELYDAIPDFEERAQAVRGRISLRRFERGESSDAEPAVLARTTYE
ncbi:hypothetical protein [Halorussus salinus]|uniref:hypothetical protein n=1 Tax=Halorussus salinus TaxID=1364935 RepID=UPI001092F12A|nr:hypothetical protein [Halorussus salinus]